MFSEHEQKMYNNACAFGMKYQYISPNFAWGGNIINTTPNYDDNIKVGVVIGTCGSSDIINLQLHYLKNINKIENVLIVDDYSQEQDLLKNICDKYNADLIISPYKLPYIHLIGCNGDNYCIYKGLEWAKAKKLDVILKFSRRFIPCYNWIDNFKKLIKESDGITFSSYSDEMKMGFRTECFGMNVNAWNNDVVMNNIKYIIDNDIPILAEYWYHNIAKYLDYYNHSKLWAKFKTQQNMTYERSGYVMLKDLMGTCMKSNINRNSNVMWHMFCDKNDYINKIKTVLNIEPKHLNWC